MATATCESLSERRNELATELAAAADHRIGTQWWKDRCREMDYLERRIAAAAEITGSCWLVRIGAVTVGQYRTEAEAERAAASLRGDGHEAWAHYCD